MTSEPRVEEGAYRRLFEVNPHPMWVYDLETLRFLVVNDAAVGRYGYSRDEFLGITPRDIRPPEDVPALLRNVEGVGQGLDRAGLWRYRLKDGSLIDVEITSHTLEFDGRRAELVLAIDVTERRRTEERRAQAGVAGFLEKPCRLEDLLDVVARVPAEPLGGA